MPLWSDPTLGLGILPAQAPFPGQTVSPGLIEAILRDRAHRQQQTQQSIAQIGQAIGGIMQQRQNDAIASQLLAGSAPQAEAFTPAGEPTPVGTPSTALTPEEIAQNKALGYPTQQLMTPAQTYAAQQALRNQDLVDMYKQAQIAHMLSTPYGGRGAIGAAPGTPGSRYVLARDPETGEVIPMTGTEFAKRSADTGGFGGAVEVARGYLRPDTGAFTNKADEAKVPVGTPFTHVQIQFPREKSPTPLPAGTWDAIKSRGRWELVNPSEAGGTGAAGGTSSGDAARAIGWAKSHPDDPRASKILSYYGL